MENFIHVQYDNAWLSDRFVHEWRSFGQVGEVQDQVVIYKHGLSDSYKLLH